jgi:hypothetical protein
MAQNLRLKITKDVGQTSDLSRLFSLFTSRLMKSSQINPILMEIHSKRPLTTFGHLVFPESRDWYSWKSDPMLWEDNESRRSYFQSASVRLCWCSALGLAAWKTLRSSERASLAHDGPWGARMRSLTSLFECHWWFSMIKHLINWIRVRCWGVGTNAE